MEKVTSDELFAQLALRCMTLFEEVVRHNLKMVERKDLREEKMFEIEIELKRHRLESVRAGKAGCCND